MLAGKTFSKFLYIHVPQHIWEVLEILQCAWLLCIAVMYRFSYVPHAGDCLISSFFPIIDGCAQTFFTFLLVIQYLYWLEQQRLPLLTQLWSFLNSLTWLHFLTSGVTNHRNAQWQNSASQASVQWWVGTCQFLQCLALAICVKVEEIDAY